MDIDLDLAEIPYDTGETEFVYARYLAPDGERWIRHGLFRRYYRNGTLASEGMYVHGLENGLWRDFHENGQLAAEGVYEAGLEVGNWRYWDENGRPEQILGE